MSPSYKNDISSPVPGIDSLVENPTCFSRIVAVPDVWYHTASANPLLTGGSEPSDYHYSDVIRAWWRLKSPASRLFIQPFIQAYTKENIKAPRHWPLWGEFTCDWWIPRTKDQ